MSTEQPHVVICIGSPSFVNTATEPQRVIHNSNRLSLLHAMFDIHQLLHGQFHSGCCCFLFVFQEILSWN